MIFVGRQFRLYPSKAQAKRLEEWAGSARFMWNKLLEEVRAHHTLSGKYMRTREMESLCIRMKSRDGLEWLGDLPANVAHDTAERMNRALRGRGFPKFKRKYADEAGVYLTGKQCRVEGKTAVLRKLKRMRIRGDTPTEGRVYGARIMRDADNWMLSVVYECADPEPLPPSNVVVGVDIGLTNQAVVYDGTTVEVHRAPRFMRKAQRRLRRAQRKLSRRQKGSARRKAQVRRVARIHRKVGNQRKDRNHKLSHLLTAKAGTIKLETLTIGAWMKTRLAKSTADVGNAQLLRFIKYKAEWRGRQIVEVDRKFPSTQACSSCGVLHKNMKRLSVRVMTCECGNVMDRDENAAVNIWSYTAGNAGIYARGDVA